jgi:hypothetical protein
VQHIVSCAVEAHDETGQGADHGVLAWVQQTTIGPQALAAYQRWGCRVRLVGAESLPALSSLAQRLRTTTPDNGSATLWWSLTSTSDALWSMVADAARRAQNTTQAGLIQALYGEDIPAATMLLGVGQPVAPGFVALLLADEMQCYWAQRPGLTFDERLLRCIFYDYAYLRPTRTDADRTWRYALVEQQRAIWETDAVLGVGQHQGGFWCPAHFPATDTEGA